jgi:hypothetical protein
VTACATAAPQLAAPQQTFKKQLVIDVLPGLRGGGAEPASVALPFSYRFVFCLLVCCSFRAFGLFLQFRLLGPSVGGLGRA